MMSMALRMMQVAPGPSCSQVCKASSKQDLPRATAASTSARAPRTSFLNAYQRRGEHLSILVAQAVRSDQQVNA